MNRAVFLDRDGVINPDPGYISRPEAIKPYPFAAQAIKILNNMNLKVLVVTNQSGIARGLFTLAELESIHFHLQKTLELEDAFLDKIYVSPYFAGGSVVPWNIEHEDRKPGIGLYKKAALDFDLQPENSYLIGDRITDLEFARNASLIPILVLTGEGKTDFLRRKEALPQFIAQDLLAAALLIRKIEMNRNNELL